MNRARMTTQFSTCVLFSIFTIVILLPNLSTAAIITSGDIDPPYPVGVPDPWDIIGNLTIGNTTDGSIEINNASQVSNSNGYVGYNPDSIGTVTVTGQNSHWNNNGPLVAGFYGEGEILLVLTAIVILENYLDLIRRASRTCPSIL